MAEFVSKRYSAKLGDGKYNEKLHKYGCLANCDQITVPKGIHEIWDKLTQQAKRRDLRVAATPRAIPKAGAVLTGSTSKIMGTFADSKNSNIT